MMIPEIIVICGPSGAGKTTYKEVLLQEYSRFRFAVSCTTRKIRAGEEHGKDYYFINQETFKEYILKHMFAEYEMVYEGLYYGTLESELEKIWKTKYKNTGFGHIPVLDIDVQGALKIMKKFPGMVNVIFLSPGEQNSEQKLRERLEARGESEKSIEKRIAKMHFEMQKKDSFHKIIVNDDLEKGTKEFLEYVQEVFQIETANRQSV